MKDGSRVTPTPPGQRAATQPENAAEKLTLERLDRHLWAAADILRGKIDSTDYKHYILALFFYKSLCDVWREEYQERLTRYGDRQRAADPNEHRFHIPKGAFWDDVRQHRSRIGQALNRAFKSIENANERLRGIFQDVNFDNQRRLPDATLEHLLRHFEKLPLARRRNEPDVLGKANERLLARFAAEGTNKRGGEFYTPKQVVRLMVECLEPDEGMSVCDPACGSGGMLLEVANHLRQNGKDPAKLRLYGQEMNVNTWSICRTNLFLHDIDDAYIARGDTLRDPKHLDAEGRLMTFDRVLANPPFSFKNWGYEMWSEGDSFGRDLFGQPPPARGDLAFLQHMIKSLAPRGRLGVVLPRGALSRGHTEAEIRCGMLEADLVEAVIHLPEQLFYGTRISTSIVLIDRDKPLERRGRVLIVDGAQEAVTGRQQKVLSATSVARLVEAFHAFRDVEGFSQVVPVDRLLARGGDLICFDQPVHPDPEKLIDIKATMSELEVRCKDRNKLELGFFRSLKTLLEAMFRDP